jgi:hypothetical protein
MGIDRGSVRLGEAAAGDPAVVGAKNLRDLIEPELGGAFSAPLRERSP